MKSAIPNEYFATAYSSTYLLRRIRTNTRLAATSIIRFYDIDILLTFRTSINSLLF